MRIKPAMVSAWLLCSSRCRLRVDEECLATTNRGKVVAPKVLGKVIDDTLNGQVQI